MEPDNASPAWFRTHAATPFLSGGVFIVFAVALLFRGTYKEIRRDTFAFGTLGTLSIIVLAVIVLIILGNYLVWRNNYFALDQNYLFHRSGLRNKTTVKLDLTQVNGVDLERNATAKILGFTALTVRHPAGENISIKYLKLEHGRHLRTQILKSTNSPSAPSSPSSPSFAESAKSVPVDVFDPQHRYQLPLNRQLKSLVLTWVPSAVIAVLLAVCGLTVLVLLNRDDPEFWQIPVGVGSIVLLSLQIGLGLVAAIVAVVKIVSKNYGFTTNLDGSNLEVTRGLLSDLSATVPLTAVHWVELRQSYMWRRAGWWRLSVRCVTAAQGDDDDAGTQILLPVATTGELATLLDRLSTHIAISSELILAVANRTAELTAVSSARTRFFHPFTHGHTGYFLADRALLVRNGRLSTRLTVIPLSKIQGVTVDQGAIQRKVQVADVVIHGAQEARSSTVPNLEDTGAHSLFEKLLIDTRSQNFNNPVSPIR